MYIHFAYCYNCFLLPFLYGSHLCETVSRILIREAGQIGSKHHANVILICSNVILICSNIILIKNTNFVKYKRKSITFFIINNVDMCPLLIRENIILFEG